MRALRLYVRALGAAGVLALMLFGIPILLWTLIGNPLPAWDALQVGDFSDDVVVHILATLAWLGWASFVLTVVVEARSQALERPAPALPALPGQQDFTRSLLAALLLAAPTLAVTATAVHQPGILPDTTDPHRPGTTSGQSLRRALTADRDHARLHSAPVSRVTPAAAPRPQPASEPAGSSSAQTYLLGTASGVGVSLAAAGLHTIVVRKRRHQHAARRPGYLPDLPAPDAARVERHLVTSAALAQALRERLQTALDHLNTALQAENRHPVVFLAARLDAERTELVAVHPLPAPPPRPWDLDQATGHWILKDGSTLEAHHGHRAPTQRDDAHHRWAWIGSSTPDARQQRPGVLRAPDETDVWLLNLTAAASIRILGEADRTVDLTRAILLSQSPTAAPNTAAPVPAAVTIRTDAHDLSELAHLIDAHTVPADHEPAHSAAALVVVDQRRHQGSQPPPAVRTTRGTTTIVLTDDLRAVRDENVRLVIDANGRLYLSFAKTPITSALITRRDIDWISPLLTAARTGALRPAPWASEPSDDAMHPHDSAEVSDRGRPPSPYSLGTPPGDDASKNGTGAQPQHPVLETAATQRAGTPRSDDALLDAELQLWHSEHTSRPRLRLLGPVEVRAAGTHRPGDRIPWQIEIVVLLNAYPQGLTIGEFTDKMWPHDADRKAATAMPRQAIGGVRHWLGVDPDTGTPYLPKLPTREADARYRIPQLLTDADLARRLYERATRTTELGIHDLQAALDLVTGPVLDQRRPAGYLWLLDTLLEAELIALITDIAHTLAQHWLTHARPDLATTVSKVALTAGGRDDITHLDLIAAAEASGHHDRSEHWLRQLLHTHDTDSERDLPPQTLERLNQLRRDAATRA